MRITALFAILVLGAGCGFSSHWAIARLERFDARPQLASRTAGAEGIALKYKSGPAVRPASAASDSPLSISMDQFPSVPFADSAIIYTITVKNNGPVALSSVLLSDPLPEQVWLFDCTSTSSGVCSSTGNLVTVSFDSLASGQGGVVSIEVVVDCSVATGTVVSNTASLSCASCSTSDDQSVSVSATVYHQPPFLTCPADINVSAAPGQDSAEVSYDPPQVRDKCEIVNLDCSPASGSSFPIGVTEVTCTATDISGTAGSCSFNVSVDPAGAFISAVHIVGKNLVVDGFGFDSGAKIRVNRKAKKTTVTENGGQMELTSKKAAKKIVPGETVLIQVINSDGELSNEVPYTRPQ